MMRLTRLYEFGSDLLLGSGAIRFCLNSLG